jgi:RHS repeat-associated protein
LGRRTNVIRTGRVVDDQDPYDDTGFTEDFGYNTRSELEATDRFAWTQSGGKGNRLTANGEYDYVYDNIGNRQTYALDSSPTYYCPTDVNQYKYVGSTQPSCTNVTPTHDYDDDGNLKQDGTFNYTWDAENRLVEVVPVTPSNDPPGNKKVKFVYDYMGRRVQKAVYTYNNGWPENPGDVQRFVYDGWNVVLVLNGSNETVRKYTWGLDLSGSIHGAGGIGGLLAAVETQGTTSETDDQRYWFFYDANGNVGQVLDATDTGNITIAARYEYDPYGNRIPIPQPPGPGSYASVNPFRFSTRWFDDETGLGCWPKRYYSPRLGRWISRDPIGEQGGLNLSEFVRNSATNRADPTGLASQGGEFQITVRPSTPRTLENMFGDRTCGAYEVQWDIFLEGYPCYYADFVYVVQKVEGFMDCHLGGTQTCRETKDKKPKRPAAPSRPADVMYYEVWRVEVGNGQAPILSAPGGDRSNFSACPWCCGKYLQRGELRGYCSFKGDRIDTSIREWEDDHNHIDTPVRGMDCCNTHIPFNAGHLPYRAGGPPGFWDNYQGGPASREASTAWNCSCTDKELADPKGPRNKSQAWADP